MAHFDYSYGVTYSIYILILGKNVKRRILHETFKGLEPRCYQGYAGINNNSGSYFVAVGEC